MQKGYRMNHHAISFLAEIAGFELARRNIYRPTAFRVRTLQPLGYISIEKRDTLFFLYKNTCLVYHIFYNLQALK